MVFVCNSTHLNCAVEAAVAADGVAIVALFKALVVDHTIAAKLDLASTVAAITRDCVVVVALLHKGGSRERMGD